MSRRLRVASVNVNGVRAAFRNGMAAWLDSRDVDVLALQEVRAERADLTPLFGSDWHVLNHECVSKGRAGVAVISRMPAVSHVVEFGPKRFNSSGRWLAADFEVGTTKVTIVSCYVNSGETDTPKQVEKYKFLDAFLPELRSLAKRSPLAAVVGDLNVGHRKIDIKNWRGNLTHAGFLPEERAYFDRILGSETSKRYNSGGGLGWIDLGRKFAGEVEGPYTWWSARGSAFDNDTGWRIDYQLATPGLAGLARSYTVDRAASSVARWSDHAPVVVDYELDA